MATRDVLSRSGLSPPTPEPPPVDAGDVARRAYGKWTARRGSSDWQLQDWLQAEAELGSESATTGWLAEAQGRLARLLGDVRTAERRLAAGYAVGRILAAAETFADAAPQLAQVICESLDWQVGVVWRVDPEAGLLRCLEVWHAPGVEAAAFERDTRRRTFPPGAGLPGRVWAAGSLVWVPDVAAEADPSTDPARWAAAAREGLAGAVGFPVRNGVEFLGVLEFYSRVVRRPDELVAAMMAGIGAQISQFIERRSAELRSLREQHDRRVGREIQRGLLPKTMPRVPGYEFGGRSVAPGVVGGDCFDFIPMPGAGRDSVGVLVADASGHGIGPALQAGQTRAYLRGASLTTADVGRLLELVNRCLVADQVPDHFVTAFLMRLDPAARSLSYASAGHMPGYLLDARGRTRAVLDSTGFPLGIDPEAGYPAFDVPLGPGDLLLLVTDGIVEADSPADGLFGMERALGLVRRNQQRTPDEILAALFAAVVDFSNNDSHDDLTAVIVKVDGPA